LRAPSLHGERRKHYAVRHVTPRSSFPPLPSIELAGRPSVWAVDDSALLRDTLRGLLVSEYDVETFASAEAMLERMAERGSPDVLLLDVHLGDGISGLEACRFLRASYDELTLPIALVTSLSAKDDVAEGLEAGANDFVSKPFVGVELRARVRTLARVRRQARTMALREISLGTMLTSIGDAVVTTDGAGRIAFLNPAAEALTGWSNAEICGRPAAEVLPFLDEATRAPIEHPIDAALRGRPSAERPKAPLLVRKDGAAVPVEDRAAPIREGGGQAAGAILVLRDQTLRHSREQERARMDAEGAAVRRRLEELFRDLPAFVCTMRGPTHVFEMANPQYQRLLGRPRPLVGVPVREALPEVAGQGFFELLDEVYRTGKPVFGNEVILRLDRHGDGRLEDAFINFVYQASRSSNGEVEGIDAFGFEVTEQVRARREIQSLADRLKASDEKLRSVVEAAGVGLWELDALTGSIEADVRMVELMGLPPGTRFGLEAGLAAMAKEDEPPVRAAVAAALNGENEGRYLVEFRTGGSATSAPLRWVESRARVGFDADGKAQRLSGVMIDITERKGVEAAAGRQAEFERQLIGIVSHDLRNPLNAIQMGAALLVRRGDLDDRARKMAQRIQSASTRATELVTNLMDFTRARLGGGIPVTLRPCDVHDVARNVVREIEEANPGRELHLHHDGDGAGQWDGERLGQVVQNLTTNALTYGASGSRVDVTTWGEPEAVGLSVHNVGAPIPTELLPKLFEPFTHGGSAGSTGLGLYIVKEILDAHGGTVDVRSNEAEGTTFTVRLPRRAA
jgi:PAS domain S-box-containing protein